MEYKGFYAEIQPQHQIRIKPNGSKVCCEGFTVRIYSDRYRKALLEQVSLAVGYELLNNDPAEAEQLVSDYLATEKAAYRTLLKNEE